MKKTSLISIAAVAAATALMLSGCAAGTSTSTRACVILPDADSGTRWEPGDRPALEAALTDAGFEADIQNAQSDTSKYATIGDQMLTKGCGVMILVDYQGAGAAVAAKAKEQGIPVIAYDRPIDGADYYVSFDNTRVGEMQGQTILDGLAAAGIDPTKASVVFSSGDPADGNAKMFYDGAVSVMEPAGIKPAAEPAGVWDGEKSATNFEQALTSLGAMLPVVPMFHVNAWGIPYSAAMTGAKLVFPGPALDGKSIYELIEAEKVTFAAGVPTVWQMLLSHMKPNALNFSSLKRTVIGGSACPPAMIDAFRESYGVDVLHEAPSKDVLLVAVGTMAETALKVAELLAAQGIGATVIDPRWVVPVPKSVLDFAKAHRLVVTIEDGVRVGGIGTRVRQEMRAAEIDTALNEVGLPDEFLEHATRGEILERVGLTAQAVAREIVAQVVGSKVPHARPLESFDSQHSADQPNQR